MPNWCENHLTISVRIENKESREQLKLFKELAPNKEDKSSLDHSDLSLNSIVRLPEPLKISCGSEDASYTAYYGDWKSLLTHKFVADYISENNLEQTQESVIQASEKRGFTKEKADLRKNNLERYGHINWYNWCIENWGTKWDVEAMLVDEGSTYLSYTFSSAWSPPISFVEKASKLFPLLDFMLEFKEPGMGFAGEFEGNVEEGFTLNEWDYVGEEEEEEF